MVLRNLLFALASFAGVECFAQLPAACDIAKEMYPGWNLGNTMEAGDQANLFTNNGGLKAETSWQNTKTTQVIIDYVKSQGFKSVRIPCSWVMGHISDPGVYAIDAAWMARVKEVVDYCIAAGLYVVLNDHWDGGWIEDSFNDLSEATVQKNTEILKNIWTQIAGEFKDYDEHLLFAGLNEPAVSTQAQTDVLVQYEQAFIDAVRATGGNNSSRTLIVQGPSTNIDNTVKYLTVLPLDEIADRMMVEVHYYDPSQFTGVWENGSPYYFWGNANHVTSGSFQSYNSTWGEESYMLSQFQKMKTSFADKGIPVILGEYGANWRLFGNSSVQKKHDASIELFNKRAVQYAIQCGMVPFVWDINVDNQNGTNGVMTVIKRNTPTVFCTPAMQGITEGVKAAAWGGSSTGISAVVVDNTTEEDTPAYNIMGQRVSRYAKGIVVINGRKYVNK